MKGEIKSSKEKCMIPVKATFLSWESALRNLGKLACCVQQNKCSWLLRYGVILAFGCPPGHILVAEKNETGHAPSSMLHISWLGQGEEVHLLQSILCSVGNTAQWEP